MITLTQDSTVASSPRRIRDDAAEQYYSLVHWLQSGRDPSTARSTTVGVTSCDSGAGTSTVALNLATAAAQVGQRPVLLLDLSGRGKVASRLGISDDSDLRAALASDGLASQCVNASEIPNLFLLGAENEADAQALTLDRRGVNELVRSLEADFGLIVVDLPPTESSVCFAVAGLLDGVLLITEAERTRRNVAARAQQRLIQAQANVLGVILNKHRQYIPTWLNARL